MRSPERKVLHKLPPTELIGLFQKAIEQKYDGKVFDKRKPCLYCKSKKAWKYDRQQKIFCRLIAENGFKDTNVTLVKVEKLWIDFTSL